MIQDIEMIAAEKKRDEKVMPLEDARSLHQNSWVEAKQIQDARKFQLVNGAQSLTTQKMLSEFEHQHKIKILQDQELISEKKCAKNM
jgi:hypothetical protein